ncbi:hypothetical protein IAQ61_010962 [Plenodomus lingam]|uniref:Predicted protein n=1 Tax=Leptosphaeria maculans (strain JN3 / isolate v23.1.3 / race Av1-4-5-6-7-8) TaxID=985895 RepID=E4ZK68_LEPMJ|nr:predicted protein [Plenodomus lingam JN3]KAH9861225.1 hypothetical protein IAQ61_010962 [Plenodomus lingam]CBX91663.1 predicted protein [Plenodomus lingam JN3]
MYHIPRPEGTPFSVKGAAQLKSPTAMAGCTASPVRPSTAHSTIRTVPPSPPLSITGALAVDFADYPAKARGDVSPDSQKAPLDAEGSRGEHIGSVAEHVTNPENECGDKGSSFSSPGTVLRRSLVGSGRSPSKVRSRSHSPRRQPGVPIANSSHLAHMVQDQRAADSTWYSTTEDEIDNNDDSDERDAPETPTPMSREQRMQAYTPLGVKPLFSNGRERKQHSGDSVYKATRPKDQSTLTLHHKQAHFQPDFHQKSKPHLGHTVSGVRIRKRFPGATEEQARDSVHNPPPQSSTRNISSSARSNLSGGTAESRRSVFSTPGRDEMERKKALVEIDEGPFAKAVSMQDLAMRRRQVSGMSGDGVESGERGGKKKMWKKGCGMSDRCCIM